MSMQQTMERLQRFLKEMQAREDIHIDKLRIGDPASEEELNANKHLPEELKVFYRTMNGLHMRWAFVEPEGGGEVEIPSIGSREPGRWIREDESEAHYGKPYVSILLEVGQFETRLVRHCRKEKYEILYNEVGQGEEATKVADTVEEYLNKGMDNGFGSYWQTAFEEHAYVSYEHCKEAIRRFQAGAVAPKEIGVGSRVHFTVHPGGGRGTVLAKHTAPSNEKTDFYGTEWFKVQCDEGSIAWMPKMRLKVADVDRYEVLRSDWDSLDMIADEGELFDHLAMSIGTPSMQMMMNIGNVYDIARRGAGLLSTVDLKEATDRVIALHRRWLSGADVLKDRRILEEDRLDEAPVPWDKTEWARHKYEYTPELVMRAFVQGLWLRAHHLSHQHGIAGKDLLDEPRVQAIEAMQMGALFPDYLRSGDVLPPPIYEKVDQDKEFPTLYLHLPAGETALYFA